MSQITLNSTGVASNGSLVLQSNGTTAAVTIDTSQRAAFVAGLDVSGNSIISVTDNTNAALRITQLGTGNALLVEDSANPDATPVVIDSGGRIIKGATSAIVSGIISSPGASTQIHGVTTFRDAAFELASWVASTSSDAAIVFTKSPSGAAGTQTIVANNEALGKLRFGGSDGVTVLEAARIEAAVDGTPGTNDMPGRLVFSTTADGGSSPTERMRIDSTGAVEIRGNNSGITSNPPNNILRFLDTDTTTTGTQPQGRIEWQVSDSSAGAPVTAYIESTSQTIEAGGNLIMATAPTGGTATERMRITTAGDVGIGTTSPVNKLEVASGGLYVSGDGTYSATGYGFNVYNADNTKTILLAYNRTTSAFMDVVLSAKNSIFENNGTERMRIDSSGNLLVGNTGLSSGKFQLYNSTGTGAYSQQIFAEYASGTGLFIEFLRRNGATNNAVGTISASTTTTTYATSSDYRLKKDATPITGALAKVSALKPVTYKWKLDDSNGEGFIAHELAEVCPHAVVGEKDAVDADGNPKYQGIDTSFLVATLTAAIQELKALVDTQSSTITALTARITALESK